MPVSFTRDLRHWVKPYRFGRYIIMFSKAPFYFSRWPTLRWKSLAWGRYEFKVIHIQKDAANVG